MALPEVAAAQEPIAEVASTPAKMWAIFSPPSAGGRPESGQASRGGLGSHHSEMISAVSSWKGAPASKLEKRRIAIAELESRANLKRMKLGAAAAAIEKKEQEKTDSQIHPDVQYLYDAVSSGRVMWGKGDAAVHMLLAVARGKQYSETGSVPDHPEMVSLCTVCKHTLGMKAWKAFYAH